MVWSAGASAAIQATVDFSVLTKPKNQMGFMHGEVHEDPLTLNMASQLMPGIWRGSEASWSMSTMGVTQSGAVPVHIISNDWLDLAEKPDGACREKFLSRPLPFQDWNAWRLFVQQKAAELKQLQPTGEIWVDIWNEPDWPPFWPVRANPKCFSSRLLDLDGSKWLETFRIAEQILRQQIGPRVKIMGPSTAARVQTWTEKLVRFCAAKGCKVDLIGWHMAGGTQVGINQISSIASVMRKQLATNPTWKKGTAGPATKIIIAEYVPIKYRWMPGTMVSFWYAMERAGIDGGALSRWPDPNSKLDGLLDLSGNTRSTWWAANAYAQGRQNRVLVSTNNAYWSLIASRQGLSGGMEFLLGNNDQPVKPVSVRLTGLPNVRSLKVQIYNLPQSSDTEVMNNLPTPSTTTISVRSGQASISVTPPRGGAALVALGS